MGSKNRKQHCFKIKLLLKVYVREHIEAWEQTVFDFLIEKWIATNVSILDNNLNKVKEML